MLWVMFCQEEQLGRLHDQVAEHVQLLVECYGMTARDHRYQDLANQAHELIFGLQVFRDTQVARRGSQVCIPRPIDSDLRFPAR